MLTDKIEGQMKKEYNSPVVSEIVAESESFICVSAGFGDSTTNIMHAKKKLEKKEMADEDFFEEEDSVSSLW